MQQRQRRCHLPNAQVTVKLYGWKREVKTFTVHEASWFVDLIFKTDKLNLSIRQYTTDDYPKALAFYLRLKEAFNV